MKRACVSAINTRYTTGERISCTMLRMCMNRRISSIDVQCGEDGNSATRRHGRRVFVTRLRRRCRQNPSVVRGWIMPLSRLLVLILLAASTAAAFGAGTQRSRQEIEARIPALTPEDTRELFLKAQAGDAMSQYVLGRAYKLGQSVTRNDAEAVKWIRKAAGQNLALAELELANMYFEGDGI